MSRVRQTWAAMTTRSRAVAVLGLVVVLVVAAGGVGLAVTSLPKAPDKLPPVTSDNYPPLPPTPSPNPQASPTPTPTPLPPGVDPLVGTDGRVTILLLGSDYRPAHPGNRTDAIMVVSVDPTTGKSAGFSIPRDTVNFPLPAAGTYGSKVNAMYAYLESRGMNAGAGMEAAVSRAFGIEIDGYAFIGFAGVKRLVGAVGGVDITLDTAYYDPEYWVNPHQRGWGLPAGTSHLNGQNALIFARSRKGDNDFGRARRQQMLVLAALDKVRRRGLANVAELIQIARETVRTDLPLNRAADLFRLFSTVDLSKVDRVVFGPRTYAVGTGGTSFALKLDVCRAWIAKHFPPVRRVLIPSPAVSPSPYG